MANYYDHSYTNAFDRKHYGAASTPKLKHVLPARPSRLNIAAICICLLVPWLLFCLMYAVTSFSVRYNNKPLALAIVAFGFMIVCIAGKLASDAVNRSRENPDTDPRWFVFLAAVLLMSWVAGIFLGDLNYFYNLEPYYTVSQLNNYNKVDPSTSGKQFMDAGSVSFAEGSKLDLSKSMVFRNLEAYCVAPVINPRNKTTGALTYDFWAIGLNCCEGTFSTFNCGEYKNPRASSGLRLMREDQRAFYRLAVQQAEATYNIRARYPLFFLWVQDPHAEMVVYQDEGLKYYSYGMMCFFGLMLFLVTGAIWLFASA